MSEYQSLEPHRTFAEYAQNKGVRQRGHHNDNYLVAPTEEVAATLGLEPGTKVMLRRRNPAALPVVPRTWPDEPEILRSLRGRLAYVPECLATMGDFAVHTYVEGVPLSAVSSDGQILDAGLLRAVAGLLAEMTTVRRRHLPELPPSWPRDGASRSFLRTLAALTDQQVRRPNWPAFGGLFATLGVPEGALSGFAERVPAMSARPFGLLHTDLHRDNLILRESPSGTPVICVDWELASYGDPLHDLATHLVRMRYPAEQWDDVKEAWARAVADTRPQAVNGLETDLLHYLDFERAQSVYPDVIRAAQSLGPDAGPGSLKKATEAVQTALELARRPLRLSRVAGAAEISKALRRWEASQPGREDRALHPVGTVPWEPDDEVHGWSGYPLEAVSRALSAEGAAGAGQVFKGTGHLNTVVRAGRDGETVVVRRRLDGGNRRERGFLDEHRVLQALESVRPRVRAPEVLARGTSGGDDRFVIHSYVGPVGGAHPPEHPADGLSLREADDLVDQLCALTDVPTHGLGPDVAHGDFYQWLSGRLIDMVAGLPRESLRRAAVLGLPNANRLRELLTHTFVAPRKRVLLHGDLNPWNLIRNEKRDSLTIIDWEMAVVGDPLYDLVRHLHLTPHGPQTRERMFRRWYGKLDSQYTKGWEEDWRFYRWMEIVRSAYIDLDRLLTGESLDTPNVRRAVDSYSLTLSGATASLGLRTRHLDHRYLALDLPGVDLIGADG
ncbi:aminoglycoside phosphotransferase family protein [Streptomyces sp. NBC_01716]|uniref:aminoglycoside phosphotransferase family protein n=1 Tax=Streptomyces sp. NBC_01716 TaxID=2975917 RepID=UPI002E37AB45|nr:aminoglycoside phosphotransferase family protein [Streptomyces sp. NBC_01716]